MPRVLHSPFKRKRVAKTAFCIAIFCTVIALKCYPASLTNAPDDLVAFFKQAISAPPDVERYTASFYSSKSDTTLYCVGARAGTNYFLQFMSDSNGLFNLQEPQFVSGRSDADAFQVGRDAISHGTGSNGLTGTVGMLYTMTQQFLNMGLTEIEPGTVRWEDNTFTATTSSGLSRYCELSISNGLPFRLEISAEKGLSPYRAMEYTYPNPPTALNGFPSKIAILGGSESTLKPVGEMLFYSVQLARRPLSKDFFAAAQFNWQNIMYTNVYSNADLYVGDSKGRMVKLPDTVRNNGGYVGSHARLIILVCFVLATIFPIAIFILQRKKTKKEIK